MPFFNIYFYYGLFRTMEAAYAWDSHLVDDTLIVHNRIMLKF